MTTATEPTLATLTGQLEEIWCHLDTLLEPLTPADWQRKHGKDWIFADLPYHLSYYDRDTVADPICIGTDLPASREAVRQAAAGLSDADLERRVFIPLVGCGWVNVRLALQSCLVHTWSHFTEVRLRLKQAAPIPSPAITHTALSFFLGMMPMMISRDTMPARPFTA